MPAPTAPDSPPAASHTMTPPERRASVSIAVATALRMFSVFLLLPVFMLEAAGYRGGDDVALVGVAMGIAGLTQALMQAVMGVASDRFGRKRMVVAGTLVFAAGSVVAALADSVAWLMVGRALQGAGVVGAVTMALLADLTSDAVRTKAMALVGISIGTMFAVSLVAAPKLTSLIGLSGLFWLGLVLAVLALLIVLFWTPAEPPPNLAVVTTRWWEHLWQPALWRLQAGVFVLHAVQVAMWVVVPALIVQAGLPKALHWKLYLPAVLGSFVLMGGLFALERRGHLRAVLLAAVALLTLVQAALWFTAAPGADVPSLRALGWLLFAFFLAFNVLEATQPSLVSRLAPASARGAALGVYNTLQSLGLFAGGALGGWLLKVGGQQAVFGASAVLALAWLALAWHQPLPAPQAAQPPAR